MLFSHLISIGIAALSSYTGYLSYQAVTRLQNYESTSEKAAKVSDKARRELNTTRSTHTQAALTVRRFLSLPPSPSILSLQTKTSDSFIWPLLSLFYLPSLYLSPTFTRSSFLPSTFFCAILIPPQILISLLASLIFTLTRTDSSLLFSSGICAGLAATLYYGQVRMGSFWGSKEPPAMFTPDGYREAVTQSKEIAGWMKVLGVMWLEVLGLKVLGW